MAVNGKRLLSWNIIIIKMIGARILVSFVHIYVYFVLRIATIVSVLCIIYAMLVLIAGFKYACNLL